MQVNNFSNLIKVRVFDVKILVNANYISIISTDIYFSHFVASGGANKEGNCKYGNTKH